MVVYLYLSLCPPSYYKDLGILFDFRSSPNNKGHFQCNLAKLMREVKTFGPPKLVSALIFFEVLNENNSTFTQHLSTLGDNP